MSETTHTPPTKPAAAPAGRTSAEILADPLIATPAAQAGAAIYEAKEFAGEITLIIDPDEILNVARMFRADGWDYLVDLTGIDYSKYPGHKGLRFGVAYMLYSFSKNARIRLRTLTDETLPSVSSVWKTANWHERETFDMFGIVFEGHPNLERILTWDEFNGHPLRKDFPLRGVDTGARIYPEVFPAGGGPKAGSTGKDVKDVNLFEGEWQPYGQSPPAEVAGGNASEKTPQPALTAAADEPSAAD